MVEAIPQPYPEAVPFKAVLKRTPQTITDFHWGGHLIEPTNRREKFNAFTTSTHFPLDGAALIQSCDVAFAFCESVYSKILFPVKAAQLPYHNLDHALITSITAQKIFLGALVQESTRGNLTLPDPAELTQLHLLFSLVTSFHEIDDWWSRYPGSQDENPHLQQAKAAIYSTLTDLGLSTHDFNRILKLNDFKKPREECLQECIKLKPNKGFLAQNEKPSLLDKYNEGNDNSMLDIASKSLCAGDFLQVINPAYLQPVDMDIGEGTTLQGYCGPYVLAKEMGDCRWKALTLPRFGNSADGTIYWDQVTLILGFFKGIALPRILSGLEYLIIGAPEEYDHAQKTIANTLSML